MEPEITNADHNHGVIYRSLPALMPILMVSIGYIDPGKWAATVEVGARFGFDLVALALAFNFSAMTCQYLSARIGVVTRKDLAEICSDEYDTWTCMFLGIQAELSVIALDLGMILGMAHGLNLVFGWDLFTCVLLTAANTILFPILALLLETRKAKSLCFCITGFILLCYILGVLGSQPEIPLSLNGVLLKFNGESAFALMSLLGAHIMPHNFYLHSSIIQWHQEPAHTSKDELCHTHLLAIFCVFSGICLINNMLMNSAANVFYSSGLLVLTFQDALSLMEQVFRSPVAPFAFLLILFISNQLTAVTWSLGGQVVLHHFLKLHIPGWLHYATIRIIAIVPAFYCVFSSGAEGMYQLLIFTQVMVALLIPSSLIPLFRVAASRSIMGANKISQLMEFLALAIFIGILGLNIIFVVEMIFGSSDWVGSLRWTVGNGVSVPYVLLLVTACASFCLMLWLAATPLKSASVPLDAQMWDWDVPKAMSDPQNERDETNDARTKYYEDASVKKQEPLPVPKATEHHSDLSAVNFQANLPEAVTEPKQEVPSKPVNKNHSTTTFPRTSFCHLEVSPSTSEPVPVPLQTEVSETSDPKVLDIQNTAIETTPPIEKSVEVDETICTEKDDDSRWEAEELSRNFSSDTQSLISDGPPSFRSLSGKSDEGGNNAGSLSKLAGLGRAGRRQLTVILDEFWSKLYDFHGQATDESKSNRFNLLLGVDPKPINSMVKKDVSEEYAEYLPGGKGSDFATRTGLLESPKHQQVQNSMDSSYGVHGGSSLMWTKAELLDAYAQNSGRNVLDSSERRYSSVRNLPTFEVAYAQNSSRSVLESSERRYSSVRSLPTSEDTYARNSSRNVLDSSERRYSSVRSLPISEDAYAQNSSRNVLDSSERRYSSVRTLPTSEDAYAQNSSRDVLDSSERRYSSVRSLPTSEDPYAQNSSRNVLDSSERRYSSVRSLPTSKHAYAQNTSHNGLDSSERHYSGVRSLPTSEAWDHQPVTVHGYQIASYLNRVGKDGSSDSLTAQMRGSGQLTGQMEMSALRSSSLGPTNYSDSLAFALGQKLQSGLGMRPAPGFQNVAVSRNSTLPSEKTYHNTSSSGAGESLVGSVNNKKYHSLPDISGYSIPQRDIYALEKNARWEKPIGSSIGRMHYEPTFSSSSGTRMDSPLAFDELSPSKVYSDALSQQLSSGLDMGSLWSRQPFEQFSVADKNHGSATGVAVSRQSSVAQETTIVVDSEAKLLQLFRHCIVKLLRLEGSDWLFGHHDGADEDLIDCVASREKFIYEAEAQYSYSDRKSDSAGKNSEASITSILVASVPNCGDGCIWRSDLIVSFGVWCIHRILDLSIMESRPELWGKYTYILNRLQGIIDPAFSRPRNPMVPCFCLQVPTSQQRKSNPSASNGMLPPTAKQSRGKCTTAVMVLDLIKDVELSISCRKGRSGTAAGDVAFPKGKENLASVLKRYKRRLSSKSMGTREGTATRKALTPVSYS